MDTKLMMKSFDEHLVDHGLKSTRQRSVIARSFFEKGGHLTLSQVHELVGQQDKSIGFATVYRTLKLLVAAGLADEHRFGDGDQAFYEVSGDRDHHDHMICVECDTILEYEEPEIERLQEMLAKKMGFKLMGHRHELYGLCAECVSAGRGNAGD